MRGSRRIIRPTVRLRIQPTSTALRIASPRRWKRQVANEYPNVRRTVSADTADATSTAIVSGRLPVLSRARNDIVSGPPTTATAKALMATSAQTDSGRPYIGVTRASTPANSFPVIAPRNNDAKNNPPRKPEPMETADATAFITSNSATCGSGYGRVDAGMQRRMTGGTAPAARSAPAGPTTMPPAVGRSQPGTRLRRNMSSVRVTPRMIAMPPNAHVTPSASTSR